MKTTVSPIGWLSAECIKQSDAKRLNQRLTKRLATVENRQKCFQQRLANGCFLAKLLILLLVSARNADTME
jgi:hypothetical protein